MIGHGRATRWGTRTAGAVLLLGLSVVPAGSAGAAPVAGPDFDGDGVGDLVMGRPSVASAGGMVYVAYGSGDSLTITGHDLDAGAAGIGGALVACDVNADGFKDLVVGDPEYPVGGGPVGAVFVVLGSGAGLQPGTARTFTQDSPGVPGLAEEDDQFGATLACGRIGSDQYDDVVVGSPTEGVGSKAGAGSVTILRGSTSGVSSSGAALLTQDTAGVPGGSELGDLFGSALAVGDLNRDGAKDLAVGSQGENDGDGAVHVLYGSPAGLSTAGVTLVTGGGAGVSGLSLFGEAMGIGDVNRDGTADLVVTAPTLGSGRVVLLTGKAGAPVSAARRKVISQASSGVPGTAEAGDLFGLGVAVGDVDGDGDADVVIGSPGEGVGSAASAGAVTVMRGGASPLTSGFAFTQDTPGVPGASEKGDCFGWSVGLVDLNSDGRLDVAVGTPFEGLGGKTGQGMVQLFRATSSGLSFSDVLGFTSTTFGDPYGSGKHLGAAIANR